MIIGVCMLVEKLYAKSHCHPAQVRRRNFHCHITAKDTDHWLNPRSPIYRLQTRMWVKKKRCLWLCCMQRSLMPGHEIDLEVERGTMSHHWSLSLAIVHRNSVTSMPDRCTWIEWRWNNFLEQLDISQSSHMSQVRWNRPDERVYDTSLPSSIMPSMKFPLPFVTINHKNYKSQFHSRLKCTSFDITR